MGVPQQPIVAYYIILYDIVLDNILYHMILIILFLCHMMSCFIFYPILYDIVLCYIILYDVVLYYSIYYRYISHYSLLLYSVTGKLDSITAYCAIVEGFGAKLRGSQAWLCYLGSSEGVMEFLERGYDIDTDVDVDVVL